jgi:hypothetical protein
MKHLTLGRERCYEATRGLIRKRLSERDVRDGHRGGVRLNHVLDAVGPGVGLEPLVEARRVVAHHLGLTQFHSVIHLVI